jgi:hypothetical protein
LPPDDQPGDPPGDTGYDPFASCDCGGSTTHVCVRSICQAKAGFDAARGSCGERCGQLETCAGAFVECDASYCKDNEIVDAQQLSGCSTRYQTCMTNP